MKILCFHNPDEENGYLSNCISSQLFKQAVETNMLTRIVAFEYELSKDEYDKMRSKAVAAVKRSTGRISLFDTMQDSEE